MSENDFVTLRRASRKGWIATAQVHLLGATLVSWKMDNVEHLFVSEKSLFDNKTAIRGGVPFVFPQFGPWSDGPQHGFARILRWSVADERQIGTDSVTFVLEDNEKTRQMWSYRFRIEYTITLGYRKIMMNVNVTNNEKEKCMPFSLLLHTYFSVPDVLSCGVTGLADCMFIDKARSGYTFLEERGEVKVADFTDRIYKKTSQEHIISNVAVPGRSIKLEKHNLPDTVIWNPWVANAKQMSDFGDDEWKNMICVEAGHVSEPVIVKALKSFRASQTLSIIID